MAGTNPKGGPDAASCDHLARRPPPYERPPDEIIEFVLDLERYRQADHKIGRVGAIERHGTTGAARFRGRLRGLPGPSGTYPFTITATRLEFGSPIAGGARWMLDFEGSFDFEETADGTRVTHREVFIFKRPWRWLAGPLLRRWLDNDTREQMTRFKDLIEDQHAARRFNQSIA
jgi:Polyketide cyclase / dehydrase and lipid transport